MRSLRSRWFEAIPSCAVLASQEFTAFLWQFSPQICFIDVKTIIIQQIATAPCAPAKSLVFTWKTYLVILVLFVCTAGIHPPCSNSSFSAKHEKKTLWQCLSRKKQVSQHSLFLFTFFCAKIQFHVGLFFRHSLFVDTLNMNLNFRVLAWLS